MLDPQGGHTWINPSKKLVDLAIDRWNSCNLRADNTSVVTVMLDPPGPPRAQVLRKKREANKQELKNEVADAKLEPSSDQEKKGISIISRYPNSQIQEQKQGQNLIKESPKGPISQPPRIVHDSTNSAPVTVHPEKPQPLQCNEVSSSDDDTPPPVPKRPIGGHGQNSKATATKDNNARKSLCRELAALQQEDGPAKRTRRQSGPASKRPPPPLPHRRSIIQQEDSDAENNLPSHRQPKKRPKTPEVVSPRVLRPRNTPQTPQETRKRQRSFESAAIAKKTPKTALKASNANNLNNSRVKLSLRSRMN